jgi:catechol 2,3-dioxygenase-like lactoylglutathione lyase family enzyme
MKRFHVHLSVTDLASSIRFYTTLFGQSPTIEQTDYAKWLLADPAVNFAISSRDARSPGVNHLGLQVTDAEDLAASSEILRAAGAQVFEQRAATCCYALSDKHWVQDPDGVAWETFHTLGSAPVFGDDAVPFAGDAGASASAQAGIPATCGAGASGCC